MSSPRPHLRPLGRLAAVSCAFALLSAGRAFADSPDEARADALFREGRVLMASGDLSHACSALTDSVAIERATGALLALALCHERQGKLGSAYREYAEVAERAQGQQREERTRVARERMHSLEPKLSTLVVTSAQYPTDLEVRIDGKLLVPTQFGASFPVDGGEVSIEARALRRKPWSTRLTVEAQSAKRLVLIPVLEPVEAPAPATPAPAASAASAADDAGSGLTATQGAGVAVGIAGVIAAGAGVLFMLHAVAKNEDSESQCQGNLCTLDGRRDRLYARDAGNAATVAFISAATLLAMGVTLYCIGGPPSPNAEKAGVSASLWAVPGVAGASVRGAF